MASPFGKTPVQTEKLSSLNQTARMPALWILVLLSAVSPLAMNMFVPSMPSIAADLDAPYASVQLGLSLFLAVTAVLQLVAGPLSDRVGRRPVIIGGLLIFLGGTAITIIATDVVFFLIGRVIQTSAAVGMVLSRAIVRDVYPREKSASMIGYVVMGMAIAPMIGPAIGGYADSLFGWRASFVVMGTFGLVTLLAALFLLPETNRSQGQTFRAQMGAWRSLLGSKPFWLLTIASGLASSVFFSFLGGGPSVSSNYLGQSPFQYGLYFSLCALGYAFGNFLSGRLSESRGIERMMIDGAALTMLGPLITLGLFGFGIEHPIALFGPLTLIGVGNGMTLPNVVAAAVSLRPEAAGAASGLLGALQIAMGAIGSVVAAIIVGEQGSPILLCLQMVLLAVIGYGVTVLAARSQNNG